MLLTCTVQSLGQYYSTTFISKFDTNIQFIAVKPVITSITKTQIVPLNETKMTLRCEVKGIPDPTVTWRFKDQTVVPSSDKRLQIPSPGELVVLFVDKQHEGMYHCVTENEVGRDEKTVQVYVYGEFNHKYR